MKFLSKLNKLDIIIIVFTLLILGFFIYRKIAVLPDNKNTVHTINMKCITSAILEEQVDEIKVGDKLYDYRKDTYIGEVSNIEINDAKEVYENIDGNLVSPLLVEGYKKINLTVKMEGNIAGAKVLLKDNKYELYNHTALEVNNQNLYLKVIPLSISEE